MEWAKNSSKNVRNIVPHIQGTLNQKYDAIESVVDTVLQFTIPTAHQLFMRVVENGPEMVHSFLPNRSVDEDYYQVVDKLKIDCHELMKVDEIKRFLRNASFSLNKNIEKLLVYKKKIRDHMFLLDKYLFDNMLPKVSNHTVINFIRWLNFVIIRVIVG